ncbi:hypothetical protein ACT7DB_31270 [Bacillus cereus]
MNKTWSRQKLEDVVIGQMKDLTVFKYHNQKKEKQINYAKLIKEIDKKMERLLDLFTTNTNISRQLLEQQMEKLNSDKEKLILKQQSSEHEISISNEMIAKIMKSFDTLEFKDRQILINKFIQEIQIKHENVEILWRF